MHRNIIILGLVSFFTDISSEMIYPLVPLYLTAVLGTSPAVLGLIEGVAESLASLLKIASGRLADRLQARKPLAILGYGLSAVSKILFVVAASWTGIFLARVSDRFGKGIRTAPRDALIADSAAHQEKGRAFGFHRGMDTAGAVIGIGLAYQLFTHYQSGYIQVFLLAMIPAGIGVGLLFLVRDNSQPRLAAAKQSLAFWRTLDKRLQYFLVVCLIFNLGNFSNQFLLLRASGIGFSQSDVILLYLLMNLTYLFVSYPAGVLSDRLGRRRLLAVGYALYASVYIGFALAEGQTSVVWLFGVYGLYIGLTEGVEKALLGDMAPPDQKASVYGLHAFIVGAALLPASLLAGLLWGGWGASAPFLLGGLLGLGAALAVWFGLRQLDSQIAQ